MADDEEGDMRSIWKRNEKRFEMEDGYLVKIYPPQRAAQPVLGTWAKPLFLGTL